VDPMIVLRRAMQSVPAVRYALGVGGLFAVIALIGAFGISPRIAVIGTILLLIGMVILLLFASASGLPGEKRNLPALVFTWFSLCAFASTSILLMLSIFFSYPLDLRSWLVDRPPAATSAASMVNSVPLPLGVTSERSDPAQIEVRIEITSTGIKRSFFFHPDAELRTIWDVVTDQLSLADKESLGGTRYYRMNWVLVDKTLSSKWRDLPESMREDYRMLFRSEAGDTVTVTTWELSGHEGPLTVASAKLNPGTTFHIFPVQLESQVPLSPRG